MVTKLKGVAVSPGVGIGRAVLRKDFPEPVAHLSATDPSREESLFRHATEQAKSEIQILFEDISSRLGESEARVFKTHLLLLDDPIMTREISRLIREEQLSAAEAVHRTMQQLAAKFRALQDEYLRERGIDLLDVGNRLIRLLARSAAPTEPASGVVVARNFTPSETALLDRRQVQAVVSEEGGVTSHAAILARALNIPWVVAAQGALAGIHEGDLLVVDAAQAEVILDPDEATLAHCRERQSRIHGERERSRSTAHLPAVTLDGFDVQVCANIGRWEEATAAKAAGADGIGVFRSEFLFVNRPMLPSEEEQFNAYAAAAAAMAPRPVVIRTLDAGADKELPGWSLGHEPNPALGLRGIRLCLKHEPLFAAQLRAIMRAAAFGDVALMLPMICDPEEVRQTRKILASIPAAAPVRVGIMIETPAAALMAEELADVADFFSIGTNDLTQYVLAVDRLNQEISERYQPFHPAILRLMSHVCHVARQKRIPVGICGESAADPKAAVLHVGLGVNELSMAPAHIPHIKEVVRQLSRQEAATFMEDLLGLPSAADVHDELTRYFEQKIRRSCLSET